MANEMHRAQTSRVHTLGIRLRNLCDLDNQQEFVSQLRLIATHCFKYADDVIFGWSFKETIDRS